MKKILSIVFLFMCCICLSGCVEIKINEELTINPDRTADHSFKCLVADNMDVFSDRINASFKQSLKEAGFVNIVPAKEMGYFGMKGSKHVEMSDFAGSFNKNFHFYDNSVDYFFFKYVDVTVNIDINSMLKEYDPDLITLSEYKFVLNLPVKITECNSNKIYNDGKSAVWYLGKNMDNSIQVKFILWNLENSLIGFGVIILLILLVVGIVIYKKKKTKNKKTIKQKTKSDFCPNCSSVISPDDAFCGNCGHKLN